MGNGQGIQSSVKSDNTISVHIRKSIESRLDSLSILLMLWISAYYYFKKIQPTWKTPQTKTQFKASQK